ncbi:hypothetical protein [Streptomyces sp. NPDC057418]
MSHPVVGAWPRAARWRQQGVGHGPPRARTTRLALAVPHWSVTSDFEKS